MPIGFGAVGVFIAAHGGGGAAALAADGGGDALLDLFNLIGIGQHSAVGMAVRVDKSGGDDKASGIEDASGFVADESFSNAGDLAAGNGDIGKIGGHARAVDDAAVLNDDVVHNGDLRFL